MLTYLFYFWLCWVFFAVSGFFSSCSEQGLFSGCGVKASHCSASVAVECRLEAQGPSSCGVLAQLPLDMWHPPGLEIKPVSPAWKVDS